MADFIANVVFFQYLRKGILSSGFSLEIFPPLHDLPISVVGDPQQVVWTGSSWNIYSNFFVLTSSFVII